MIEKRPPNSRLIGQALVDDIAKGLLENNHYSLIGPPFIGKSLIIDEVKKKLKPKIEKGFVLPIEMDVQKETYLTTQNFVDRIASHLNVTSTSEIPEDRKLSDILLDLITKRCNAQGGRIVFFFKDLLGLTVQMAREVLSVLSVCHLDDSLKNRVTSVISGGPDLIPLVQGQYSPFRFSIQYSIEGLDLDFTLKFLKTRLNYLDLTVDALEYLYNETNGNTYLLNEIALSYIGQDFGNIIKEECIDRWDLQKTKKVIERFEAKFLDDILAIRTMMREIERKPDQFNKLLEIKNEGDGKLTLKADVPEDMFLRPGMKGGEKTPPVDPVPFLVACGAAIRDENRKAHISSPILRRFFKKKYTPRRIADIFCNQYQWDNAWKIYKKLYTDQKHRSVSGEDRFRLFEILKDWENSMHQKAMDGIEPLLEHFYQGARHLLVFDQGVVWDLSNEEPRPLRKNKGEFGDILYESDIKKRYTQYLEGIPETQKESIVLSDNALSIYIAIREQPPEIPPIYIHIKRRHVDRGIDPMCFNRLQKHLKGFVNSLCSAVKIEYQKSIGETREKHINVIRYINYLMIKDPFDMGRIVQGTADALVKIAGYYRIMICLVDAKRERIEAVAGKCRDPEMDFNYDTNYSLLKEDLPEKEEDWDVQPWVIKKNNIAVIPNASSEKQKNPSTQSKYVKNIGMKAITVVPIRIKDQKAIGTIHFEKSNKGVPNSDEIELFTIFAGEVAIIFRHAERLTLLQTALDALDDEVRIVNPRAGVLFKNKAACENDEKSGWTSNPEECKCKEVCRFKKDEPDYCCLIEEVIKNNEPALRYETPESEDDEQFARDWLMGPIDDFRKYLKDPYKSESKGRIGYVERVHDIYDLYIILTSLQKWLKVKGVQNTAQAIIKSFKNRGYKWCRIYLIKNGDMGEFLESFEQGGMENEENIARFQRGEIRYDKTENIQPWHAILTANKPTIYEYREDIEEDMKEAEPFHGFPRYWTKQLLDMELLGKEDKQWVEAPLYIGVKAIGLFSLSMPPERTPRRWEIMRCAIQGAAVALDDAIRAESESIMRENIWKTASWTAVHQLGNKLIPIESNVVYASNIIAKKKLKKATEYCKDAEEGLIELRKLLDDFERYASDKPFEDCAYFLLSELLKDIHNILNNKYNTIGSINLVKPIPKLNVFVSNKELTDIFEILLINTRIHGGLEDEKVNIEICASISQKKLQESLKLNYLRILFKNNGNPIPQEERHIIFNPFVSTDQKGDGLGLAIAKRHLQRMGGDIFEEGKANENGAFFAIYLPFYER